MNNLTADLRENDIPDRADATISQDRLFDLLEIDDVADFLKEEATQVAEDLMEAATGDRIKYQWPPKLRQHILEWFCRPTGINHVSRADKRLANACDEDEFARATGRAMGV